MADLKISEMTPAAELTGAELIECVQGGVNVKQGLTGLKTWVNNGVQPFSSTLDALSSFNTNGVMVQTAADTFTGRTITAGTGISVTNGDGVSGNPTISLAASGVTAGTYGSSTQIPVTTYTAQGIATSVVNTEISFPTQFSDSTFRIQDDSNTTKQLAFEVSGIAPATMWTWTVPNANVNFGDLANVATTAGNELSGTRTRIVGGLANTVSGTDNVAVLCASTSILSSTGNYAQNCTSLTVPTGFTYCNFLGVQNGYTGGLSPILFSATSVSMARYTGWLNSQVTAAPLPKGYIIHGHQRRKPVISGITTTYDQSTRAEVGLTATSTGTAAVLKCIDDTSALPLTFSTISSFHQVIHELDICAVSEGSGTFIGKRIIKEQWSGGTATFATETVGTDLVSGGFTISLVVATGTASAGVNTLALTVKNTANASQVFWQCNLRTFAQTLDVII